MLLLHGFSIVLGHILPWKYNIYKKYQCSLFSYEKDRLIDIKIHGNVNKAIGL